MNNPPARNPTKSAASEKLDVLQRSITASMFNYQFNKKSYFSVCPISDIRSGHYSRKQTEESDRAYEILRPLHCKNFSDIPDRIKRTIPMLITIALAPYIGELVVADKKGTSGVLLFIEDEDATEEGVIDGTYHEVGTQMVPVTYTQEATTAPVGPIKRAWNTFIARMKEAMTPILDDETKQ